MMCADNTHVTYAGDNADNFNLHPNQNKKKLTESLLKKSTQTFPYLEISDLYRFVRVVWLEGVLHRRSVDSLRNPLPPRGSWGS